MSEFKYFKPDDFKGNSGLYDPIQRDLVAKTANEKTAPVLALLKEMGEAVEHLANGTDIFPQRYADEVLEKLNTFLASIDEETK